MSKFFRKSPTKDTRNGSAYPSYSENPNVSVQSTNPKPPTKYKGSLKNNNKGIHTLLFHDDDGFIHRCPIHKWWQGIARVQNWLVRLKDGEDDRCDAGYEELGDDSEDVVDALGESRV